MEDKFFETKRMGNVPRRGRVSITLNQEVVPKPVGVDIDTRYRITARIGTEFVCNDAQYDRARENALKQIKHHFYGDLYEDLYEVMSLGDAEVMEIVGGILDRIKP